MRLTVSTSKSPSVSQLWFGHLIHVQYEIQKDKNQTKQYFS